MPRYRLKILCDIDLPVRDDIRARGLANSILLAMSMKGCRLKAHALEEDLPATATLVCEEAKDGRNILPPASASS